jgi:hypothetical protein
LFRFNRNSLFRLSKQTVSKQTEKNEKIREKNQKNSKKYRKNYRVSEKNNRICSLSNCFGWSPVCFGSIETSNSLFRYRSETTETNVLFRIVPKLVSVPVSVVSNRNYFRRTPYTYPCRFDLCKNLVFEDLMLEPL